MTNGSYLTRDQILAAQDLPAEDMPVPEWGGTLRVRGMTAGERDAYRREYGDGQNAGAKFLAATIVDENGSAVFSAADIAALAKKSAAVTERILAVAMRLSGLQAGAAAAAEKNSAPSPSASSSVN